MMKPPKIKHLGTVDYEETYQAMKSFTLSRSAQTQDEIWILQHNPVFTMGQAALSEHLLNTGDIPVVQTDRGGQVTYHGPGQLVIYPLIDIERLGINVRPFVTLLEESMVTLLDQGFGLSAFAKADAPGVYIRHNNQDGKIGSIGLRIKRGASYHGLSLNVNMDLSAFARINPCGYAGLMMLQLDELAPTHSMNIDNIGEKLANIIVEQLEKHTHAQ